MHHHLEPSLPGIFARDVGSGQVEHVRSSLRTDTMHQHFLSHTSWARNQNRLHERCLLVYSLGP